MKPAGDLLLTMFLCVLSLHLGQVTAFDSVTWLGCGLSLLAYSQVVKVERPTFGLVFVLLATGALAGSQILGDWALEDSWTEGNGFGAGLVMSLLLYMIWLFAARGARETTESKEVREAREIKGAQGVSLSDNPMDRDRQTVLVWGLVLVLLIPSPEGSLLLIGTVQVAPLAVLGPLLAAMALIAHRCGASFMGRIALLVAPLLVMIPLTFVGLQSSQGPLLGGLARLFPSSGGDYSPTGFSPFQQLRASAYVRPSTRPVLRIETETLANPYLAGNRLLVLDDNLVWLAAEKPQETLTQVDAVSQDNCDLRFPLGHHQADPFSALATPMKVHNLGNENYLFVTPGTAAVSGRFTAMIKSAADVWLVNWERGADRRWLLEPGISATPDTVDSAALLLPAFWDGDLQQRSEDFAANDRAATVANVLGHFQGRGYTLQTNFDPDRPFHDFYLNDSAAYCFWFATATTLALRANGIPSRLVGGYRINEQLSADLWLVRDRDAHSWVEWQDEAGFWHTVDPTPSSIFGFFDGYESSAASQWYHRIAGQWQQLIDQLLADALTANLIRYGGLAILVFLFAREYRRLRGRQQITDTRALRWQRLWERFVQTSRLPVMPEWTASVYADNLPVEWTAEQRAAATEFLQQYEQRRFGADDDQALGALEQLAKHNPKFFTRTGSR